MTINKVDGLTKIGLVENMLWIGYYQNNIFVMLLIGCQNQFVDYQLNYSFWITVMIWNYLFRIGALRNDG